MDDRWKHPFCNGCWEKRSPGREPDRDAKPTLETCCVCHLKTMAGIYVVENPEALPCGGQHGDV